MSIIRRILNSLKPAPCLPPGVRAAKALNRLLDSIGGDVPYNYTSPADLQAQILADLAKPDCVIDRWDTKQTRPVYYTTEHYQIRGRKCVCTIDLAGCGNFTFLSVNGENCKLNLRDDGFDFTEVVIAIQRLARTAGVHK